jgi:hypothetical protein
MVGIGNQSTKPGNKQEMNPSDQLSYIYQLPAKIISEISATLDTGNSWEIVGNIRK